MNIAMERSHHLQQKIYVDFCEVMAVQSLFVVCLLVICSVFAESAKTTITTTSSSLVLLS